MTVTPLGILSGGAINIGAALALPSLQLRLGELNGQLLSLQGNLDIALGVTLPDPTALIAAAAQVVTEIESLLSSVPSASLDLSAGIAVDLGAIELLVLSLEALIGTIEGGLNAGGIAAYAYDGPANRMGAELGQVTSGGVAGSTPEGNVNGLLLACADPEAWASLSAILKTS